MTAIGNRIIESLDVIVPLYNESEVIETFDHQLRWVLENLGYDYQIIYVDDGSSDETPVILEKIIDSSPYTSSIRLSRNFGHQAALTAGLDHANSDVVVMMDGDGQHPPEVIPEMADLYCGGYEIVLTQRIENSTAPIVKRSISKLFYKTLNQISETNIISGSADFRLMSRKVAEAIKGMGEYHRFIRGMIAWTGYKTIVLPYKPGIRYGGVSKYTFKKMFNLAIDAIFSFSLFPLRIGLGLGILFLCLAIFEGAYVLSFWIAGNQDLLVPGWSSLMFMFLVIGGILMIMLGIIGIYIGYVFQQVKNRPSYLIDEMKHSR